MSYEQTLLFLTTRDTTLNDVYAYAFRFRERTIQTDSLEAGLLGHPSGMVGLGTARFPRQLAFLVVTHENTCLPTAHRKSCYPCLSGPSSLVLFLSRAALSISNQLCVSSLPFPISLLSTVASSLLVRSSVCQSVSLACLSLPGYRVWVAAASV